MPKITPFLWFDKQAEEATKYYINIFPDAKILETTYYAADNPSNLPKGSVMTISFELDGQNFTALNGGPVFTFNEAISFSVACKDQAEIDRYWAALSAVPESEQCGWCKDKFGLSWQIIPENM